MATQQQAGRAYNIFDIPSVMRYARRQPQIAERDIESENALRKSIIEQIAELEKVDADIKKGVIGSYTEQQKAVIGAYSNMVDLLGTQMQAQAATRGPLASALDTLKQTKNNAEGILSTGMATPEFSTELGKTMIAPSQDFISKMRNRGELGPTAELFAEMLPAEGSPALYDQDKFDQAVTALDQMFVSGPTGLVRAYADAAATSGESPQFMAPNAVAAMQSATGAIATAVNELEGVPQPIKERLYQELSLRAQSGIKTIVDRKDPAAFQSFAATQNEASRSIDQQEQELVRRMGVGVDKKEREKIMAVFGTFKDAVAGQDPTAALAIAERQLAEQGIARPPDGAPQEQQAAYTKALTQLAADARPMETFAERMANIPGSQEIREQIKFLKGMLPGIGKVAPDPLSAATEDLKAGIGDAAFAAWKQMTGAQTDEDAAVLAANDPTKFAVFRRVAQADAKVLTNPRQYAAAIGRQAATEKATARQEARAAAPETVAGTAPQRPVAPTEPEATKKLEETQQPSAAVERRKAAFEEEEGEVAQYQPPEETAAPAPIEPFRRIREAVAQAEPLFAQKQTGITSPRAQLFGAGGLMAQRARGG